MCESGQNDIQMDKLTVSNVGFSVSLLSNSTTLTLLLPFYNIL